MPVVVGALCAKLWQDRTVCCSLKEGLIVIGILLGYLASYLFVDQVRKTVHLSTLFALPGCVARASQETRPICQKFAVLDDQRIPDVLHLRLHRSADGGLRTGWPPFQQLRLDWAWCVPSAHRLTALPHCSLPAHSSRGHLTMLVGRLLYVCDRKTEQYVELHDA